MRDPTINQALNVRRRFGSRASASRATGIPATTWQSMEQAGFIHPRHYKAILEGAYRSDVILIPADFAVVDPGAAIFVKLANGKPRRRRPAEGSEDEIIKRNQMRLV